MKAYIQTTDNGYVVNWLEKYVSKPLRCFGWYKSAAIEFCNIINYQFWEGKMRQIDGWINSYNPAKKYTYPSFSKNGIILKTQRF